MIEIKDSLIKAIININNVEERIYNEIKKEEENNDKESDIIHYIENNDLSASSCVRAIKELKIILLERRKIKQLKELYKVYGDNKSKLQSYDNRPFLIAELEKITRQLDSEYKNKKYTNDELDNIIKPKKGYKNDNNK